MRCHSFIKQYLNASNADEVEHLKSELESVKAENAALQKELAELKVCSHPLPAPPGSSGSWCSSLTGGFCSGRATVS